MNIGLVNHTPLELSADGVMLQGGLIAQHCYEVAKRLGERGNEVFVYSPTRGKFFVSEKKHGNVTYVTVPSGLDWTLEKTNAALSRFSGRSADRRRPQAASKNFLGAYIKRVALHVRRRGCTVIKVLNHSQFVRAIRQRNPESIIHLHMHCEWLSLLDRELVLPRVEECDLISGCSEFITERIRKAFPDAAERCFELPDGVDAERYHPDHAEPTIGLEKEAPHLVFHGRLSPERGVHDLLAAFKRIQQKIPAAKLTLIGSQRALPYAWTGALSEDATTRELDRFYNGSGTYADNLFANLPRSVARGISSPGGLSPDALAKTLRTADVFVQPSSWEEPGGMRVLQAMASGLPIVATRSGGIAEFIEEGQTGCLVERGAPLELFQSIMDLLKDPAAARRMGRLARRQAMDRWGWEGIVERMYERYPERLAR
jgi:glycosyltransferase involved in cell wall biosynthesis